MPRVFKDVIITDDSTKLDRDAKKKAADDAANAYAAAQAVVGKAENDTLAALVFLGGKASVANADGETISNYFVDKDSPVGYSIDVVPDGAVAEIPDAPAPDGPPAVTPPPPPQPLPESPPPPPSPVESNAGPQPIAVAVDPLTQAMSRTRR